MAKLQLVELFPVVSASSAGAQNADNLTTPDPKEITQANGAAQTTWELDLGEVKTADTAFLGFHNASPGDTVRLRAATAAGGAGTITDLGTFDLLPTAIDDPRASTYIELQAAHSSRYWLVDFLAATQHQVGVMAFGQRFEAEWDREFGSGRRLVDTSGVTPLPSGGFGVQPGARKAAYGWTFGDLTDAETETVWGMAKRNGIGAPMVVHENPDATIAIQERIHYGLIQRFNAFERRSANETKWQLELVEWI